MKRLGSIIASLMLLCWLLASPPWAGAAEIVVSAAASLTNAMSEAGRSYERRYAGAVVVFNFAASGILLRQLIQGAPVDVFASADQQFMDRAGQAGLIDGASRRDVAANRLVLAVPAGEQSPVTGVADLTGAGVGRIALGNPEVVPAGRYARISLQGYGLWEALGPRLITANSVRQVLDYLRRGEVDAGFVYASDALIGGDRVRVICPMAHTGPITYPVAVTTRGRQKPEAGRFVRFLTEETGAAVFERFGFSRP